MSPSFASYFLNEPLNSLYFFSLSALPYLLLHMISSLLSPLSFFSPCPHFTCPIPAFSSLWLSLTNLNPWAPPFFSCTLGCMDSFTVSLTSHTYPSYSPTLMCLNSRIVPSWSSFLPFNYHPTTWTPRTLHNLHTCWRTKLTSIFWVF